MGAAFLMATSAIGPGFITQTTVFTARQKADFGFVILISILIDIVVQLNIWRISAATGMKAQQLGERLLPGTGVLLSVLVVFGGLVFNVGNIAGAGMGLQALLGMDIKTGAALSGFMVLLLFAFKEFGTTMDWAAKIFGFVMIALMIVVVCTTNIPFGEMALHSIAPRSINSYSILTLVGGTVGGYISFAGAHRMLDAANGGVLPVKDVNRSAVTGILISGLMRFLLFAAVLGVVSTGFIPDPVNPPASIFQYALGKTGQRIFGLILWSAAITSVVGASFTSISFLETWHPKIASKRNAFIMGFIMLSTVIFAWFGRPVNILVAAGALNGLVLPIALLVVLLTAHLLRKQKTYAHPWWLTWSGWLVWLMVIYLSYITMKTWIGG